MIVKEQAKQKKTTLADRSKTGIAELDAVLGGGFPRNAIVLVAGASGTGKTVFSLEWLFNGVNKYNENGVYVTFTEPLFTTLKNLEGMSFYDRKVIEDEKIRILDIRKEISKVGFKEDRLLDIIEAEVKKNGAKRLVIDSITAFAYNLGKKAQIRRFIFDLGTMLATLGCTTLLTSEVPTERYSVYGVEEFISDGILMFRQVEGKFQTIRSLEIAKMRGIQYQAGTNAFRIGNQGIRLFPKLDVPLVYSSRKNKISIGVDGFDEMAHGGVFEASTNLVAGSTGSGKSVLGLHFTWKGLQNNEPCLLAGFEESKEQIIRNANGFGFDFEKYEKQGLLKIMCAYPTEKYIEEHLLDVKKAVETMGIKRCVVDSLSSIGNSFEPDEFRYFVKTLNAYLKSNSVTSLFTTATASLLAAEKLTEAHLSTMTDNIFLLKYVEAAGEMKLMATVLKTRGDDHSKSLREYAITNKGIIVGEVFKGYESVMMGAARKVSSTLEENLKEAFIEYLGPIGITEFKDLKQKGALREEDILNYIRSLMREGSLKKDRGEKMIAEIHTIYGSTAKFSGADVRDEKKKSVITEFLKS